MAEHDNTVISEHRLWQQLQLLANSYRSREHDTIDQPDGNTVVEAAGLYADFSKHPFGAQGDVLFSQLAEQRQLGPLIEDYFAGRKVNSTEQRPALHTALRRPLNLPLRVAGHNIMTEVGQVRERIRDIVTGVQSGQITGLGGEPITQVINIGIGGSDLGPLMATRALQSWASSDIQCHFLANVDRTYTRELLQRLDPATTLVVIVSKSFKTAETIANAQLVCEWLSQSFDDIGSVLYAVTSNVAAAQGFGIASERVLPMWDWVGGRYSLWSAVGLVLALAIGMDQFESFLAGAYAMDQHFVTAPWSQNMPCKMAFLGVWYTNFMAAATQAIIPYSDYLRFFPDYLQQLHMESLGKRVDKAGREVEYATGQVIWGGVGTSSQHSFHQLLMCGTHCVPVDFILPARDYHGQLNADLIANCLAQSEVLWRGTDARQLQQLMQDQQLTRAQIKALLPHQSIPGGCGSTTIVLEQLTAASLGALVALYEHKVFVQSVLWNINAFDQWGVECGKQLAAGLLDSIQTGNTDVVRDRLTSRLLDDIIKKEFCYD